MNRACWNCGGGATHELMPDYANVNPGRGPLDACLACANGAALRSPGAFSIRPLVDGATV